MGRWAQGGREPHVAGERGEAEGFAEDVAEYLRVYHRCGSVALDTV